MTCATKERRNSPRISRLRWVDHGVSHDGRADDGVKEDSSNDGLKSQEYAWRDGGDGVEYLEICWRIKTTSFQLSVTACGFHGGPADNTY